MCREGEWIPTKTTLTPVSFDVFKQPLFWPGSEYLCFELKIMNRYFSICFHIPLPNRDVSTYGHPICGYSFFCCCY